MSLVRNLQISLAGRPLQTDCLQMVQSEDCSHPRQRLAWCQLAAAASSGSSLCLAVAVMLQKALTRQGTLCRKASATLDYIVNAVGHAVL